MIIYKSRFFKRINDLNAEVGEVLISKSESEKPHENYEVHLQRLLGVWKPLGSFNDLGSAISYGETFENTNFLKDDYQLIKAKDGKYLIIFVRNKYDEIRKIASNRNMNILNTEDIGDSDICVSFLESKDNYIKDVFTAIDESDMVSFGNYLLSKERERKLKNSPVSVPYKDRFREVNHADIENWKYKNNK